MKFPDVNLLVAMTRTDHAHHERAEAWRSNNPKFVTCPITELGLLRVLLATGTTVEIAETALEEIIAHHRAKLVPCDESADIILGKVKNHRQTTDAYLLALAAAQKLTLCTFDEGIKGAELVD